MIGFEAVAVESVMTRLAAESTKPASTLKVTPPEPTPLLFSEAIAELKEEKSPPEVLMVLLPVKGCEKLYPAKNDKITMINSFFIKLIS